MDFYITKYQGKSMQVLTPLFAAMTQGIQRLEQQEAQEQAVAEAEDRAHSDDDGVVEPARKQRKTLEDLQRRARRVTIRLASMANRSFWVSTAELVVHILTDGDALQSHSCQRIFTRQLQWLVQHCKSRLNGETKGEESARPNQQVQAIAFQAAHSSEDKGPVEFAAVEACTASTNTADDYAHRGPFLKAMPFYVYRMYVRRIGRTASLGEQAFMVFDFDEHYPMAVSYKQQVSLHRMTVPTIDGFQ